MSSPRGWGELAQLGPLTDRLDARCEICQEPALVKAPEQWRCAQHPPQPGEWGHGLNWAPRTNGGTCAPNRCYCSRCPEPAKDPQPRAAENELLQRRARRLEREHLRIAL